MTLQAVPPRDRELTKEDLDRSVSIMRDRVDKLGVAEPEIRTQGDDQISIQLPGVKDPAAAAAIIGKTAQLELFDLQQNLVAPSIDVRTRQPIATPKLYDLLAGQQSLAARGKPDTYYVFETKGKKLVRGPVNSKETALAKWDGKLPAGYKLFAVPPQTVVVRCGPDDAVLPGRLGGPADERVLVPLPVRPARGPGDERARTSISAGRGRTSTRGPASPSS